jgi:hypothetical protein
MSNSIDKINASNLTKFEKKALKLLIIKQPKIDDNISRDNECDDDLLRSYLTLDIGTQPKTGIIKTY